MDSTYDVLLDRLQAAFERIAPGSDPVLRHSDRGDYQANGVMSVAKQLGRPPREVAQELVHGLEIADIAEVEIAGPGFLNLTLNTAFLEDQLRNVLKDPRMGVANAAHPKKIVIDYSAPNVAKEMHVGHLRSTVIGDALARMYRFGGHQVIARNHVGDWGTNFGMLIEHLVDLGEQAAMASLSIGDLDSFYRDARAKFDADDTFKERSRTRVVSLQAGDPETRRLWAILVDESVAYFAEVYAKLDVTLAPEDIVGESYYNDMLADVVTDLDEAGLLVESGGALCVFPAGFTN